MIDLFFFKSFLPLTYGLHNVMDGWMTAGGWFGAEKSGCIACMAFSADTLPLIKKDLMNRSICE